MQGYNLVSSVYDSQLVSHEFEPHPLLSCLVSHEFEPQPLLSCFLEQETLPSLPSTAWFLERILA